MKESTTYQYLIEEGMKEGMEKGKEIGEKKGVLEGVRRTILLLGEVRFGKPSPAILKRLRTMDDVDRLDRISKKLMEAASWKELLETP